MDLLKPPVENANFGMVSALTAFSWVYRRTSFLMSGQKEEFSSLLRCVLVAFLELFLKYLAVGSLYLFQ